MKVQSHPQISYPSRNSQKPALKEDSVNIQSSGDATIIGTTVLGAAIGGGLGVFAGLRGGGVVAGIAGGAAGAAGAGFLGVLGAARTGTEEHTGTIASVCAIVGGVGGAYLASSGVSPIVTAVALGAGGALTGGFIGMMSNWK